MQPIFFLKLSNRITINVANIDYIVSLGDSIRLVFDDGEPLNLSPEEAKEFRAFMLRMQEQSQ